MEPSTPNRPLGGLETSIHADFTRDQQPSSPTNINPRPRKQQQRVNNMIPPPLRLGDRAQASNTASNAINGRLDAIERANNIRHAVVRDFGTLVDKFVSSYQQKEQREFAHDIGKNLSISFPRQSLQRPATSSLSTLQARKHLLGTTLLRLLRLQQPTRAWQKH